MNPFAAGGAAIADARLAVDREWDEWALAEAKPVFDAFREQAAAERWNDAYAVLSDIEDDWKSPQVRRDFDGAREQVKLGLRKAAPPGTGGARGETSAPAAHADGGAHPAPAGAPAATPPSEPPRLGIAQELQARMAADFWAGFDATSGAAPVLVGEAARFSGTGTASQRLTARDERQLRRGLYFTVRFDGDKGGSGGESWGLVLGPGRMLAATTRGLVITGGGAPEKVLLASPLNGMLQFQVRRELGDLELRIARGEDWQPLHVTAADQLIVAWKVPAGVAEVRLKPLIRKD